MVQHNKVEIDGKIYDAIKFGDDENNFDIPKGKCHDCGIELGEFHHDMCDLSHTWKNVLAVAVNQYLAIAPILHLLERKDLSPKNSDGKNRSENMWQMRKTIYETNFEMMVKLGIITSEGVPTFKETKKMKSGAFMDLNLDFLISTDKGIVISMAHNFVQNGDDMADPDMEIRIVRNAHMVEALSYRQDAMGINNFVYTDETEKQYSPLLKKELNSFLNTWLKNLINQGFSAHK